MIIAALIVAYLLGSIPFGLILTRMAGLGDIRAIGSGNIGATNVLRTGNKKLAALTLLLDMIKGFAAMLLAFPILNYFDHDVGPPIGETLVLMIVPFIVTLGHCYPVWLKFKGGKGVATALGAILAFGVVFNHFMLGIALLIIWLVAFAVWLTSSLASLITFGTLPLIVFCVFSANPYPLPIIDRLKVATFFYSISFLPISLLIFWRHKDNIRRLLAGTEPKFGKKA